MDQALERASQTFKKAHALWLEAHEASPTLSTYLPLLIALLTLAFTFLRKVSSRSRRHSRLVKGGWLGDKISDSMLYSNRSAISDGGKAEQLGLMKDRDLRPNSSHLRVAHWCRMGARQYQEDRYAIEKLATTSTGEPVGFYGVFDGHGGYEASQYCADRFGLYLQVSLVELPLLALLLLTIPNHPPPPRVPLRQNTPEFPNGNIAKAYKKVHSLIDSDFISTGLPDGTTVCTCLVFGSRKIYCANAGDSRAIIVKRSGRSYPMR